MTLYMCGGIFTTYYQLGAPQWFGLLHEDEVCLEKAMGGSPKV